MNTRSHNLELVGYSLVLMDGLTLYEQCRVVCQVVAARQVEEVTKAVFHTILLHRTTGKVNSIPTSLPLNYSGVSCCCSIPTAVNILELSLLVLWVWRMWIFPPQILLT